MKKFTLNMLRLGAAAFSVVALSAQAGSREEAQAMLKAALTEIKTKGLDAASKDFAANATWNTGTQYLFVADMKATVVAHSANGKLIGKNLWEAKDASGKLFVQEQVKVAQDNGSGTVQMRWMNPTTKQIGDAEAVVGRVPGQDLYVGAVWFK